MSLTSTTSTASTHTITTGDASKDKPKQQPTSQKYQSEIDRLIQLGLIDKDTAPTKPRGLPPIPDLNSHSNHSPSTSFSGNTTTTTTTTTSSSSSSPLRPRRNQHLPNPVSPEVTRGLRTLARLIHKASRCPKCALRAQHAELQVSLRDLEATSTDLRADLDAWWSRLETEYAALGTRSQRSRWVDLKRRREELDGWVEREGRALDESWERVERRWAEIGGEDREGGKGCGRRLAGAE